MEVNTQYNIVFKNDFREPQLDGSSPSESLQETELLDSFKTPQEIKRAEIEQKVMMDLKDVQNFLYMLIGSEIQVKEGNSVSGTSLDISA